MAGRARALVVTMALVVLAGACSGTGTQKEEAATGGTLVFGAEGQLKGFNEGASKTAGVTTRNVAENIFFYAAKATPDFRLDFVGLDRPPAIVSTNPQVVEWVVKREAVWSDGTPVTSEDLRYYWEQATNEANDVDVAPGYDQITTMEVTGEKSVRATFDRPFGDYATLFAGVPQAAFLKAQPGGWDTGLNESPGPSAGPFMVEAWDKDVSLTLVRNPRWWGATKPALERIVFRFLASSVSLIDALANGEVDLITPQANADLLARARTLSGIRVDVGVTADWEQLTFNTRTSALSDPLVRRAVASAIDRNAVADVAVRPISESARPLGNFVFMPNQSVYQAHDAAYARADPAVSQRLLQQAGWAQGGGGWTKGGETLRLTLSTTPGEPTRVEQMDLIRSQLEKIGVAVTRDDCVIACLRQRMAGPGPFDITGFGWTGGVSAPGTIKAIYETGSSRNFGKWSSPRFDDLMRSAVAEADPARQAALANQADQVLWDELPALPLYQKPNLVIVRERFVGPKANGGGDGVFWNSQEWTAKAGR